MITATRSSRLDFGEADVQAVATPLTAHCHDKSRRIRVPTATYRLQLNSSCTFANARRVVPYLAKLGISHCYVSPFLKARTGSPHGYDIVDHTTFNPEIGTEAEFKEFVSELHAHGMGLVLDFVPNHMSVATADNAWWMDVLEDGPSSPYAGFFDIDWMPLKPDLANKVLLPVLGDQFGRVLEDGQLTLTLEQGMFSIHYFDRRFPIAPRSTAPIFRHRLEQLKRVLGSDDPNLIEYQSILTAIGHLPPRTETDQEKLTEGRREKEVIRRRLNTLLESSPEIRTFLLENVRLFNGSHNDPRSFDLLDELLLDQAYRLAYWRVAADEINYRRFFDVNELAAICVENPAVFESAHQLVFRLMEDGLIDGLRIDHPDGLYDPLDYFIRLAVAASEKGTTGTLQNQDLPEFYLVVEKILGRGEHLPAEWPVDGTTGYDFLNAVNGLFVDRSNAKTFDALYTRFTHESADFKALAHRCKKLIMDASMSSEVSVLGHELDRMSEHDRSSRDFTRRSLTEAIREVIACFPVYRTYITSEGVPERDRRYVELAVSRAKRLNPAVSDSVFDFVRDILLLKDEDHQSQQTRVAKQLFVSRFQQVTSPIMAKAVEDTAFYINNRLVSLNEVGGDPEKFGVAPAAFHQQNLDRLAHWPSALLATSTHDTKRSEDVRSRINVLSELPGEWRAQIFRWSRVNLRKKVDIDGERAPSRNDEYLLYQTLIGTWPVETPSPGQRADYIGRIQRYMLKALREAKVHTSWINPNLAYERAMNDFVAGILQEFSSRAFMSTFESFARRIAEIGIWNSLAQSLLKMTCPGVPDIYQGTELNDFSLVDPDNRRPVDFALRQQRLDSLEARLESSSGSRRELTNDLLEHRHDGTLKLYVIWQALKHRQAHPDLYANGTYVPMTSVGRRQENVCAFARVERDCSIIVVVPRLMSQLVQGNREVPTDGQAWEDTSLTSQTNFSNSRFKNVLTGSVVQWNCSNLPLSTVLGTFPIALLSSEN